MESKNISDNLNHTKQSNEVRSSLWRDYGLCGYLHKITERNFKGLKYSSANKRRWCVYSDKTGKLYIYRSKSEAEPIEEINIALSTFSYDLENSNDKQFIVSCGNKDSLFETSSDQERMFWLQQLQSARQDYNHKMYFSGEMNGTLIVRPKSGLIKDSEVETMADPYEDLVELMEKPVNWEENQNEQRSLLSSISLPLNLFKGSIIENSKPSDKQVMKDCNTASNVEMQDGNKLEKVGHIIRNSMRVRMTKSATEDCLSPKCNILCKKCITLKNNMDMASAENSKMKDSWEASKEAVNILQHQVEVLQNQNSTLKKLDKSNLFDGDILEILREKDEKIVSMESSQLKLKNTLSKLTSNLRDSRIHVDTVEGKLSMLSSLIEVKEKLIIDLSNKLEQIKIHSECFDQIGDSKFYTIPTLSSLGQTEQVTVAVQTARSEYDSLMDKLEGYRAQNCFLNKEILDLNLIRKQMHEREQKLISESSEWEAKFYQIQSKYLLLLNDLHSPQTMDGDNSVVPRLLQDLVESYGSTDLRSVKRRGKDYDEFGFCIKAPVETDLLTQATFLQKQSIAHANQVETASATADLGSRWESFIASTNTKEMLQHNELKNLIRFGIPYQYKGKIWGLLVENGIKHIRNEKIPTYYQTLLSERISSLDPFAKQIEVDLLRTLPNNRHYESSFSDGISKLRRVLLAFSRHNLEVGYCQGLNRLAAVSLLFLNEEDAFWCLVYIVEVLMPPFFYSNDLLGSQVDQRVLKDLLAAKLPNLYRHFEKHSLDVSLFTFNWFLCIYVDVIPPSTYLYIWDSFLFEGSKVLFRFALAIFRLCEESIIQKQDYLSIFNYLRSVPEPMLDVQRLGQVAFCWANPLPMKYIKLRREYHLILVKEELQEVEASRQAFKEAAKRKHVVIAEGKEVAEDEAHSIRATIQDSEVFQAANSPPIIVNKQQVVITNYIDTTEDTKEDNCLLIDDMSNNSFETVDIPDSVKEENWEIVPSQNPLLVPSQ